MKYRKKPIVVEAMQITEAMILEKEPLPDGVREASKSWHPGDQKVYSYRLVVETLEGIMEARIGDWIITGVKGERYPCKPDIFEATYEPMT